MESWTAWGGLGKNQSPNSAKSNRRLSQHELSGSPLKLLTSTDDDTEAAYQEARLLLRTNTVLPPVTHDVIEKYEEHQYQHQHQHQHQQNDRRKSSSNIGATTVASSSNSSGSFKAASVKSGRDRSVTTVGVNLQKVKQNVIEKHQQTMASIQARVKHSQQLSPYNSSKSPSRHHQRQISLNLNQSPLADLRRQTFDSIDAKKRLIEKQMSDAAAEQKRLADIEREKQSKLAEEERLRNEMRSKAEAAANQRRAEQALRESQLGAIPAPSVMDPEGYKWMRPYEIMMDELRNVLKPAVRANKEIKKWCFEKQRQIKVKFGQLTDEWSVLSRNTSELNLILNEAEGRGPEVYAWIANLFAKAIVSQAEDELSTERGRVFPSARVCVLLASAHPLVMDMVLARLIKKCPHIVPRQFTRSSTETMDDVKRKMRYRHKKDPDALQNAPIEWESDADYLRRMTSMLSLYAAIVQTVPEAGVNLHGIEYGWTWIARMLRLPNSSFLSADLMLAFLEIAGPLLLDTYGDMMRRVVNLIRTEYYASLPKDNPFAKASNARFEACLEHYIKTGQFKNIDWRFCHI